MKTNKIVLILKILLYIYLLCFLQPKFIDLNASQKKLANSLEKNVQQTRLTWSSELKKVELWWREGTHKSNLLLSYYQLYKNFKTRYV